MIIGSVSERLRTGLVESMPQPREKHGRSLVSIFATFTRIVLPITLNGIIATGIFIFLEAYTHSLLALMLTNVNAAPLAFTGGMTF